MKSVDRLQKSMEKKKKIFFFKFNYVSGRMKNAEKAKHIKTIPPTSVTVFGAGTLQPSAPSLLPAVES